MNEHLFYSALHFRVSHSGGNTKCSAFAPTSSWMPLRLSSTVVFNYEPCETKIHACRLKDARACSNFCLRAVFPALGVPPGLGDCKLGAFPLCLSSLFGVGLLTERVRRSGVVNPSGAHLERSLLSGCPGPGWPPSSGLVGLAADLRFRWACHVTKQNKSKRTT